MLQLVGHVQDLLLRALQFLEASFTDANFRVVSMHVFPVITAAGANHSTAIPTVMLALEKIEPGGAAGALWSDR